MILLSFCRSIAWLRNNGIDTLDFHINCFSFHPHELRLVRESLTPHPSEDYYFTRRRFFVLFYFQSQQLIQIQQKNPLRQCRLGIDTNFYRRLRVVDVKEQVRY